MCIITDDDHLSTGYSHFEQQDLTLLTCIIRLDFAQIEDIQFIFSKTQHARKRMLSGNIKPKKQIHLKVVIKINKLG